MKLALFDGQLGMIALLDPVITKPSWTALMFEHLGFAEAMKGLFDDHWRRAIETQTRMRQSPEPSPASIATQLRETLKDSEESINEEENQTWQNSKSYSPTNSGICMTRRSN